MKQHLMHTTNIKHNGKELTLLELIELLNELTPYDFHDGTWKNDTGASVYTEDTHSGGFIHIYVPNSEQHAIDEESYNTYAVKFNDREEETIKEYTTTELQEVIDILNYKRADQLSNIIHDADLIFWEAVAAACPEIKTGDMEPSAVMEWRQACKKAVEAWYEGNQIAPEA